MSSLCGAAEYFDYYGRDYSNMRKNLHQKLKPNEMISSVQVPFFSPSLPPKKDVLTTKSSSSLSHEGEEVINAGSTEKKRSTVNGRRRRKLKSLPLYTPLHGRHSFRPSFADQLRLITNNVSNITKSLSVESSTSNMTFHSQEIDNASSFLSTMPASCFSVGTLPCKFPSPVHFYATYCTYVFYPMYENAEIYMTMHYNDMHQVLFTRQSLRFRILKELKHFKKDYSVANAQHMVSIQFAGTMSEQDFLNIKSRFRNEA